MTRWLLNSGWPGPTVKRYYKRQFKKIPFPFHAMIDHLMYKNFLKNTTNVITNEQKSKKFEKQFSRWLYIFMKEKQSTQWNAWQQHTCTWCIQPNSTGITCTLSNYKHDKYTIILVLKLGWCHSLSCSRAF